MEDVSPCFFFFFFFFFAFAKEPSPIGAFGIVAADYEF
jgi:hypothetical protein